MISIGIDGGKKGAIVSMDCYYGYVKISPMPLITSTKGRDEYDVGGIVSFLKHCKALKLPSGAPTPPGSIFVTLERAVPMPPRMPGGSLAQFNRGVQRGFEWLLMALEIPFTAVPAQTWQKEMLVGTPGTDTKQRSILAAQRLFPSVDLRRTERSKKPDHNFADALLLAEYGRRKMSQQIPSQDSE